MSGGATVDPRSWPVVGILASLAWALFLALTGVGGAWTTVVGISLFCSGLFAQGVAFRIGRWQVEAYKRGYAAGNTAGQLESDYARWAKQPEAEWPDWDWPDRPEVAVNIWLSLSSLSPLSPVDEWTGLELYGGAAPVPHHDNPAYGFVAIEKTWERRYI